VVGGLLLLIVLFDLVEPETVYVSFDLYPDGHMVGSVAAKAMTGQVVES
jgi:hypothetical protein